VFVQCLVIFALLVTGQGKQATNSFIFLLPMVFKGRYNYRNTLSTDTDSDASLWYPGFVDLFAAAFIVALFMLVYHYFASGSTLELLGVRAKQAQFLQLFEREFAAEIAANQVNWQLNGNLQRLNFGEELLFEVGQDTLSRRGMLALDRFLQVVNKTSGQLPQQQLTSSTENTTALYRHIQVEGHTDSLTVHYHPNSPLSKRGIKDNWDLAAARANNVVRYCLQKSKTLPPSLFSASSYSWYQWLQNPEQPMYQNRKVSIVLVYTL
jgi:flagellar motor protein MotB